MSCLVLPEQPVSLPDPPVKQLNIVNSEEFAKTLFFGNSFAHTSKFSLIKLSISCVDCMSTRWQIQELAYNLDIGNLKKKYTIFFYIPKSDNLYLPYSLYITRALLLYFSVNLDEIYFFPILVVA